MSEHEAHVCPWYLAYLFDNPLRKLVHHPGRLFGTWLKTGMIAADIGCGMGYFSIGMAKIVGPEGSVYAADLQPEMLKITTGRAHRAGVGTIVRTVKCDSQELNIPGPVDFALACWVVHETPDPGLFYKQVRQIIKSGGHLFVSEPFHHVDEQTLQNSITVAEQTGFRFLASPPMRMSKTAVFTV